MTDDLVTHRTRMGILCAQMAYTLTEGQELDWNQIQALRLLAREYEKQVAANGPKVRFSLTASAQGE